MLQTFEDLAPGSPVYNQYDGVTLIGGNNTNPDGSHPITIFQPVSGTISSSNAVQSNIRSSCEFCGTSLTLRFEVFTIQGFDPSGNTLFVHNFMPYLLMDANESLLHFDELIPFVSNLDRLVVLKGAQMLGELTNNYDV